MDEIKEYDFGLRLRQLRERKGLTQKQLGAYLGVTRSTVNRYEMNTQSPPLDRAIHLVKILNTSLDYLAGIEKEPVIKLFDISNGGELSFQEMEMICNLAKTTINSFRKTNSPD